MRKHFYKFWIRFLSVFILDKNRRRQFRRSHLLSASFYAHGKNNHVFIRQNGKLVPIRYLAGLHIAITGNHNRIEIDSGCDFRNVHFNFNHVDHAIIQIGPNCQLHNLIVEISRGTNQFLKIGSKTTIGSMRLMIPNQTGCIIGEDCMFSSDILIWTGDGHSLLNQDEECLLNQQKYTVQIGNHCWVGWGCALTKNAILPNNTIVGMHSVVSRKFIQENTVIAGNPAKVIKTDVSWNRQDPFELTLKKLKKV